MIRYQRDQDDEPMHNEENAASGVLVDEYGQPVGSAGGGKELSFAE